MKSKTPHRNNRIAEQILKDLALLIKQEIHDKKLGFITLQYVELTPDYAHAKIFVSVFGSKPKDSIAILNSKAGFLHSLLYKRLHIHTVPTLHFYYDDIQEKGFALSQLISQANKDNKNIETKQDDENNQDDVK